MFKTNNFEDELFQSMQKQLKANASEETFGFNKLAKAADYLNNAADLFDDVGMHSHAKAITSMLEKIAHDEDLSDFEHAKSTIEDGNFSSEELKKLEEALHEKIEASGGTPMGEGDHDTLSEEDALDTDVVVDEDREDDLNHLTKKKVQKSDKYTKGLTSKKMVENYKRTGTPFDYHAWDSNKLDDFEDEL